MATNIGVLALMAGHSVLMNVGFGGFQYAAIATTRWWSGRDRTVTSDPSYGPRAPRTVWHLDYLVVSKHGVLAPLLKAGHLLSL